MGGHTFGCVLTETRLMVLFRTHPLTRFDRGSDIGA